MLSRTKKCMMNGWFKRNRPINLATSFHSKYIHVFIHTLLNDTYSPRLQRGVTQIKEELVSIQTCKKEDGESSAQWVTSTCHSSLGCKPRGLIPCAIGRRCRSLQVEQLLIISLAWGYGIFHWRRQWHPTPVLWPGKSHGRRSLVGCSPWGSEESDTTEWLHFHPLGKEMATHTSVLAWRIPGMGEPGGLPSTGSQSQTRLKQLSS